MIKKFINTMLKVFCKTKHFNCFFLRLFFKAYNSLMSLKCFLYTTIKVDILPGMVFAKIVNLPSICVGGFLSFSGAKRNTWC